MDPRLLLALQQRFPSVPALQSALEDLVRQHATDKSLQVSVHVLSTKILHSALFLFGTTTSCRCCFMCSLYTAYSAVEATTRANRGFADECENTLCFWKPIQHAAEFRRRRQCWRRSASCAAVRNCNNRF